MNRYAFFFKGVQTHSPFIIALYEDKVEQNIAEGLDTLVSQSPAAFEEACNAYKCRWCDETIDVASTGPPKNPHRLSCENCKENDSSCMNKDHPGCGHPVLWHHSMPTRRLADCIRPDCVKARGKDEQSSDDFCAICGVDELGRFPCVKLRCDHIFHVRCVLEKLKHRWEEGEPVNLAFMDCPLCKVPMDWPVICQPYIKQLRELLEMRDDLKHRLVQRVDILLKEQQQNPPADESQKIPLTPDSDDDAKFEYGKRKLNFYECCKCKSFYYGGRKECDAAAEAQREEGEQVVEANQDGDPDPAPAPKKSELLICGGCQGSCPVHGSEEMVYKCRFCCSVAQFFCFGHTHFCRDCHTKPWSLVSQNNYQFVVGKLQQCEGPEQCSLGIEHPPNGEEFVLGCALCGDYAHLPKCKTLPS